MTYATTLDAPPRGQFEAPYRGSIWDNEANVMVDLRAYDCGPTGAAFIDGAYHSRKLKIGYVRSLGAPEGVGTSAPQCEHMLDALGIVTDQISGPNITTIRNIVVGRRRPVLVAVRMSYIPQSYSQDTFTLNHWLVICATSTDSDGTSGVVEMDPNAPASTGAFHFIPNWALQNALIWNVPLVVPRYSMPASLPDTATEGHPVWLDNVKAESGTIHFSVGAKFYSDPGKVAFTAGAAGTVKRVMSLLHTDGSRWSGYVLKDPYSGVRLVNNADPKVNITVP